ALGPQFAAVPRVERPEAAVNAGADKDQIASGRDSTTETWRAGFDSPRLEVFEDAERHTPLNVAGVRIHRDEFSPGRSRTRVLRLGIPESATFRGHLTEALSRTQRTVAASSRGPFVFSPSS